jgi:hypothetical protein
MVQRVKSEEELPKLVEIRLKERIIFDYKMNQILEFMFRRDPEIGDLKYLFKIFFILIILAIINPEIWVVLVGGLLYFTYHFVRSHISS